MNTVKKGNSFEDRVFTRLKKLLAEDQLGLHPASCKMYQKKGYYSPLRQTEIITDISIEIFAGKNAKPIMTWIIECKDYGSPIPVNDIEEFDRKVTQITGLNTKGVFVSSNSFQKGALNFSINRKIALIRLMPDEQVEWLSNFIGIDWTQTEQLNSQEFQRALAFEQYIARNRDFYAYGDNKIFGSWAAVFQYF